MVRTGATFAKVLLYKDREPSVFASYLIRIRFKENIENKLYWYFTKTVNYWAQANSLSSGAAQPHFNGGAVKQVVFRYPKSVKEQNLLIEKLDALATETKRLEAIYRQKLDNLAALKQSILQKAFAGELKMDKLTASNVIPFPRKIAGISSTDLHAGILAIAYQQHEKVGNQKSFGHIKAEKIAHMIESLVGIDLERQPIKAQFGPNDYKHLMTVESRAKKAGFFLFQRQAGDKEYKVTKYSQFNKIIDDARTALGIYNDAVDKLLKLMLPMTAKQAEIFATVFAAWNNLLLSKQPISDEAVVYEARENWHKAKLEIDRKKFFEAISWMKEKNITPQGKGKLVSKHE